MRFHNDRLIAVLLFASAVAFAADAGSASGVPAIAYDSVPDFLKLPPDLHLGEPSGVAVNSKKHIFVFNRGNSSGPAYGATAAQVLEFGPDGKYIREIGHNLYAWSFAHAVRVDKDDNLWAVDKGSDMVIKFNPEGRVVMVFGRKKEASDEGAAPWTHPNPPRPAIDGQFRQPTDVTWDPEGNIFISDGYINSRVAKYDKTGDADRENSRIQVFDHDGNSLKIIKIDIPAPPDARVWYGNAFTAENPPQGSRRPGSPWAICITPGPGTQYLYSADSYPGRVYKLTLDGQVLGMFGSTGRQSKQFGWIHEMACPAENELYVAEILNWRVQKLLLHPRK